MRAVIQRVEGASVSVDREEISRIGRGVCCLIGVEAGDGDNAIDYISHKICNVRIFDDEKGLMNLDVGEVQGEILLISQFTLLGDARKGRRPSYSTAEGPENAQAVFDELTRHVSSLHPGKVATGRFQTTMDVHINNYGPVTILLDSRKLF